jgi:hypothetical protein
MAKPPKTPKPPLDASLWAEAEKAIDEWSAKASTELDRRYRESGRQPPTPAKVKEIADEAALRVLLVRVAYLSRLHTRDVADLHERIAKLERQAKGTAR